MTTVAQLAAGSTDPLLAVTVGSARVVIMNRPACRNALSRQMRRDFPGMINSAELDTGIAVVILTGMDPAFSGGVDLKERASGPAAPIQPNPGEVLRAARKPIIAAVNGACVTGALEMALSCSFIIASTEARFADTHAKVGLIPRWGQTALLPNAAGVRRARQMMLTGAFITAQTALDWGLVNEVTAPGLLLDRCLELGRQIAAGDQGCVSVQMASLRDTQMAQLAPGLAAQQKALADRDSRESAPERG